MLESNFKGYTRLAQPAQPILRARVSVAHRTGGFAVRMRRLGQVGPRRDKRLKLDFDGALTGSASQLREPSAPMREETARAQLAGCIDRLAAMTPPRQGG
jgi:hypothetical protein